MKTMLVFKHQGKPKVMKILVDYSKMANIPKLSNCTLRFLEM